MPDRLPILVLAGSDRQPAPVPRQLKADDRLTGLKGALRLPSGRCLAGELVERLKKSERFEDPILIGPRKVYAGNVDCEIVDVEGDLAMTLAQIRQLIRNRFDLSSPVAFSTCDILPTPDEIRRLLAESYDPHASCFFWGELIEAQPQQMGASRWKPSYHFLSDVGQPLKNLYPGHLMIARPAALRMRLASHLLQLVYSHRNLDHHKRYLRMILRGLGRLIAEDFRNLFSFKPPLLSISIPYFSLRAYFKFRRQRLTVPEFAQHFAKVFLHNDHHQHTNGPAVVFAITPIVSFAKDIDTKAELAEMGAMNPDVTSRDERR